MLMIKPVKIVKYEVYEIEDGKEKLVKSFDDITKAEEYITKEQNDAEEFKKQFGEDFMERLTKVVEEMEKDKIAREKYPAPTMPQPLYPSPFPHYPYTVPYYPNPNLDTYIITCDGVQNKLTQSTLGAISTTGFKYPINNN